MTTKHSHSDHNDVDANVVEHPSVPEPMVEPTASASTTPVEAVSSAGSSSSAASEQVSHEPHDEEVQPQAEEATTPVTPPVASAEGQAEEKTEASQLATSAEAANLASEQEPESVSPSITVEAAEKVDEEKPSITIEVQQEMQETAEVPATSEPSHEEAVAEAPEQPAEAKEQEGEAPVEEPLPVVEATAEPEGAKHEEPVTLFSSDNEATAAQESKEAEVRSFTSFIEEFRQAEALARYDTSLRESQLEAFALLSPLAQRKAERDQLEHEKPVEIESSQVEMPSSETETPLEEGVASNEAEPEVTSEAPQKEIVTESTEAEAAKETEVQQDKIEAQPTKERAVSPLLRPASRIRLPRHSARHLREEREKEKAASAEAPAQPESQEQPAPVESTPPRPARRYRFDRPASTVSKPATATGAHTTSVANGSAPAAPSARAEESIKEVKTPLVDRAIEAQPEASVKPVESTASREQQTAKKAAQEVVASDMTTIAPVKESGRRRSHERQKEVTNTMATAPVAPNTENAPSFTNMTSQVEEIAPEDLPPLEYSELQKASTRRRRRHRSSTGSASATPEATTPATPPAPVAPRPQTGSLPPSLSSLPGSSADMAYSIVSGYTINQMNHGNDLPGPFMGPEPSPARGSVISRDGGRTVPRAEVHRAASYPVSSPSSRGHDSAPTTAALNHFTNAIVQALQLQSDRLVTEMRRQSQAPTSVSVSLPPFPSTERVGVFVDVANLLYSARTLRLSVDFGKLLDFLRGNRRLVRAHAYCPTSPQAGDEQMFLQAVKGLGYRITTKNYKTFSSGAKKADLDLDLCMDVVRLVDGRAVDCIVLVSGDSDFMPMLDYCSDHGVRVEVAAFDEAMSATLRQSCDLFVNLSMLEEIRS